MHITIRSVYVIFNIVGGGGSVIMKLLYDWDFHHATAVLNHLLRMF